MPQVTRPFPGFGISGPWPAPGVPKVALRNPLLLRKPLILLEIFRRLGLARRLLQD